MICQIADLRVRIKNKFEYTQRFCQDYVSCDSESPCDIVAEVSEAAFNREKALNPAFPDGYIENICLYRDICYKMPAFDRFLLHSAVVDLEGDGYAFLGNSGVGKSTHTALWLKAFQSVKIINGDKPIVHFDGENFYAYGTPWMGKEGRGCNSKTRLRGLCFLEQSKENSLRRLDVKEVADRVLMQIVLPDDAECVRKTLDLIEKLIETVPAWLLKCDISEEAVKTSFSGMTGKDYAKYSGRQS